MLRTPKVSSPLFAAMVCGVLANCEATAATLPSLLDPPLTSYSFHSTLYHGVILDSNPTQTLIVTLDGPTTVHSEDPASNTHPGIGGVDTVDTEIVSMDLSGSFMNHETRIRVGADNGFLPGLERTRGQVQDVAVDGNNNIDFPADSIFDVFLDLWIDFNDNNLVSVGEVFRNFDFAARMRNPSLSGMPPALDGSDPYLIDGSVELAGNSASIGTFSAPVTNADIVLYVVNQDGSKGDRIGILDNQNVIHIPTPEIDAASGSGALSLLVGAVALVGERRRRKAV